jgi:hypothetical protein
MKPRIAISFSGGRSSARMAELVYDRYGVTHEIKSCFVNTGKEREETLEFVHACDENIFDGELVWIESVTHGAGKGQTAKVVTYETAARNGEPFEAAIQKYGVFGPTHPQCNSRLKTEPMLWWRKSEGWEPCTYDTAIGIRADEVDRCSSKAKQNRLIYPLVEAGITKGDVNKWCAQFDWDLKLKSDADGNCGECWKKSLRKLMTIAKHEPERFQWWAEMEKKYGHIDNAGTGGGKQRVFYRGNLSAGEIVAKAQTETFREYRDSEQYQLGLFSQELDVGGGCGDSCEIGADE